MFQYVMLFSFLHQMSSLRSFSQSTSFNFLFFSWTISQESLETSSLSSFHSRPSFRLRSVVMASVFMTIPRLVSPLLCLFRFSLCHILPDPPLGSPLSSDFFYNYCINLEYIFFIYYACFFLTRYNSLCYLIINSFTSYLQHDSLKLFRC